jgi:hypothetical protein
MAAPINGVGMSRDYITKNLGEFGDYCPVSLIDRQELVKAADVCACVSEYKVLIINTE